MDKPSSTSAFRNATILSQDPTTAFSPSSDDKHAFAHPTVTLEERQEPDCTQTVAVPVWYGPDYNTCTMQPTTAPCSVSFPQESCHTSRPASTTPSPALSGTTKLWIVIGVTILLTILIPVVVLWARWKLRAPRRGGKRSISVQLEKNEAKKSTAPASSGPKRGRNFLQRLLGRNRRDPAHAAGNKIAPLAVLTPKLIVLVCRYSYEHHPHNQHRKHHPTAATTPTCLNRAVSAVERSTVDVSSCSAGVSAA